MHIVILARVYGGEILVMSLRAYKNIGKSECLHHLEELNKKLLVALL